MFCERVLVCNVDPFPVWFGESVVRTLKRKEIGQPGVERELVKKQEMATLGVLWQDRLVARRCRTALVHHPGPFSNGVFRVTLRDSTSISGRQATERNSTNAQTMLANATHQKRRGRWSWCLPATPRHLLLENPSKPPGFSLLPSLARQGG